MHCSLILILNIYWIGLYGYSVSAGNLKAEFALAKLPNAATFMLPVYDGDDTIYLFGVNSGGNILRYDISTDYIQRVGQLPNESSSKTACVEMVDQIIYYFGGNQQGVSVPNTNIVKFDPKTNIASSVAFLPIDPSSTHQVSIKKPNSTIVYVFIPVSFNTSVLFECDMSTYTIRTVTTTIYSMQTSVVLMNDALFLDGYANFEVVKVNPFSLKVERIADVPEELHSFPSAATDGIFVYMIGGYDSLGYLGDYILQFDPAARNWTTLVVDNFPYKPVDPLTPRYVTGPTAVFVEQLNRIYYFGGLITNQTELLLVDDIWYIDLGPMAPSDLPTSTPVIPVFTCEAKPNGIYPHPTDWSKFVWCRFGVWIDLQCPCPAA